MNNSLAFIERKNQIGQLRHFPIKRKRPLVTGMAGICKTTPQEQLQSVHGMPLHQCHSTHGKS